MNTLPERPDLDLQPDRRRRHPDHQRADVAPDVQQDGPLSGPRVLGHATEVVPGSVW